MKKGLIVGLFAFTAMILVFGGCSKERNDVSMEPLDPNTEATIVVGGWPSGDAALKAILPGFNEKYPNVTVEFDFKQTAEHHQQLSTAIAAGSGACDVAMLENGWVGRYREGGGLVNLLEAPFNAGELKDDFADYKWDLALSVDGSKLVGLVWDVGPATLFYNREIFADAGLPTEPEDVDALLSTWDGVLEAAEAVYIPNERWLLPNAYYLYSWNFMNRDFYNQKLELNLDKPGSREALEASIVMRRNNWDAQLPSMWDNEAFAGIADGRIAMIVAGCWYGGFLKSWIAPEAEGVWGVASIPGGIEDSNWGGSFLAIPSQSENKRVAWEFVKYALATTEAQNTMFEVVDYFPGYIPAWDDPMYEESDPYFADQHTRAKWVDVSKHIKPTFSTLMDNDTELTLNSAVNAGLNEGLSVDEILANTREQIESITRDDRERTIETLKDAGLWD